MDLRRKDIPVWSGLTQDGHQIWGLEGVSKCDFAMSRDVACRVSIFVIMYKILNINSLFSQIVEGVSK